MNHLRLHPEIVQPTSISRQEQTIIGFLEEFGSATEEDIQELLGVKKTRAFIITKQMSEKKLIRIQGRGSAKRIFIYPGKPIN